MSCEVTVQMFSVVSDFKHFLTLPQQAAAFGAIHITNEKQAKNKCCACYATADHKLISLPGNHNS